MGRGGVITHPPPLFSQIGSYNLFVKTHPTPFHPNTYTHPLSYIYIMALGYSNYIGKNRYKYRPNGMFCKKTCNS